MDEQEFQIQEKILKDTIVSIVNELHKPNFYKAQTLTKELITELRQLLKIFSTLKIKLNSDTTNNIRRSKARFVLQITKILGIIYGICDPDNSYNLPYPIPPKVNLDLCIDLKEQFDSLLYGELVFGKPYESERSKRTKRHNQYVKKHSNKAYSKKYKRKRKRKRRTILKKKK